MGDWNHAAVYVHDLTSDETIQLTGNDWIHCYPDIYGDIVVWADYRFATDPNSKNSLYGVEIFV